MLMNSIEHIALCVCIAHWSMIDECESSSCVINLENFELKMFTNHIDNDMHVFDKNL